MILYTVDEYFLVPFLATKETLAPLANDPILLGRSIWSFRHLDCQNPSIISDSIDRRRGWEEIQRNGGGTEYIVLYSSFVCCELLFIESPLSSSI